MMLQIGIGSLGRRLVLSENGGNNLKTMNNYVNGHRVVSRSGHSDA